MQANEQIETVFLRLLDEGTDVVRPTSALTLGDGSFQLLPTSDYDPETETWEFLPGSKVQLKRTARSGGTILLAVAKR
jgi:hypothetical protein